jgi:hypothetical protein
MSATRKLQRSIARAKGLQVAHAFNADRGPAQRRVSDGEAKAMAIIPTSRRKTLKYKKLQEDMAKIRAANDAAVAADPDLATMTDEQLAERNLKAAEAKAPPTITLAPA